MRACTQGMCCEEVLPAGRQASPLGVGPVPSLPRRPGPSGTREKCVQMGRASPGLEEAVSGHVALPLQRPGALSCWTSPGLCLFAESLL